VALSGHRSKLFFVPEIYWEAANLLIVEEPFIAFFKPHFSLD